MEKVKISIIIPTYNRSELLVRAVESVLSQAFEDFELIIVDDGSTDNTREMVQKLVKKDSRIKYIYQENSGGAAKPKNVGIKSSQGDYIAILDSDDEWLPQKLEKQLDVFEKSDNPNLSFVTCNALVIGEKKIEKYNITKPKNPQREILMRDYLGSGSGMIYKREVFDAVGGFDESLKSGQDWEMRIRLLEKYDFEIVDDYLIKYYLHEDNISKTLGEKRKNDLEHIFNKYIHYYENDKELLSQKLRYDGTRQMIEGYTRGARKSFSKSLKENPKNYIVYFYILLSFFGKSFYYKMAKIKNSFKK